VTVAIPPRFKTIEDEFKAALSVLDGVLSYIEQHKPEALLRVMMLNNTIVALVSISEETLRGLFDEYLTILEDGFSDYRWLRAQLQSANLESAMQLLREHRSDPDFDAAAVVRDLSKCLDGVREFRLFKEGLTFNKGNFRSRQLTEIAKNIGMERMWEQICDAPEVEAYTGQALLETRVNKMTTLWNAVFDERDLVVHSISKASGWGAERIRQAAALFGLIIARVGACLVRDVTGLVERHDQRLAATAATEGEGSED
jgi:hypothetical protein